MTLASSYSPLPGSTSYKALEIIRRDGSIARGPLADALGINVGALPDVVEPLVKHALVLKARNTAGLTTYQTPEHVGAKPQEPAADLAQVGATLAEYFRAHAPKPAMPEPALPIAPPVVQERAEEPVPAAVQPAPVVAKRMTRLYQSINCEGGYTVREGGRILEFDRQQAREMATFFIGVAGLLGIGE
jgi:hypothetical protein